MRCRALVSRCLLRCLQVLASQDGLEADVGAELLAVEVNQVAGCVGVGPGLLKRGSHSCHVEHAPARGEHGAILGKRRARVVDRHALAGRSRVKPGDDLSLLVTAGLPA